MNKREKKALEDALDKLNSIVNDPIFGEAMATVQELRDKASEKDRPTDKDEARMEAGTGIDSAWEYITSAIESLSEVTGVMDDL
jgi:hypothetical protein